MSTIHVDLSNERKNYNMGQLEVDRLAARAQTLRDELKKTEDELARVAAIVRAARMRMRSARRPSLLDGSIRRPTPIRLTPTVSARDRYNRIAMTLSSASQMRQQQPLTAEDEAFVNFLIWRAGQSL
jgi:hypothetical protein